MPPSPQTLTGACLCGAVRFEVRAPFSSANYCHCTHCQRRTGTAVSANARVPEDGFAVLSGEEHVRAYEPPNGGAAKHFCTVCGSALFSRKDGVVGVRLGTLDADPGIRPQYRQFVRSAASWEPVPDDGLPRFEGSAP